MKSDGDGDDEVVYSGENGEDEGQSTFQKSESIPDGSYSSQNKTEPTDNRDSSEIDPDGSDSSQSKDSGEVFEGPRQGSSCKTDKLLSLSGDMRRECKYACVDPSRTGYLCQHKTTFGLDTPTKETSWRLGSCYIKSDETEGDFYSGDDCQKNASGDEICCQGVTDKCGRCDEQCHVNTNCGETGKV